MDGARIYFDTRMDDHAHFYLEDSHDLTDVPTGGIQITGLPDAPAGMVITRVDVVIRLRRS